MLNYACQRLATRAQFFASTCSCQVDEDNDDDIAFIDELLDQASDMVAILSGGRVRGVCLHTVRPLATHTCGQYSFYWGITEYNGASVIPLPGFRVSIVEVLIDGSVLAEANYRLVDGNNLLRIDGDAWPVNNDLTLDTTQAGTFAITYREGLPPDVITRNAVNELACELFAEASTGKSRLPPGTRSLNIQGASVEIDPDEVRDAGLAATARFLGIYAPSGRSTTEVWSPELLRGWTLVTVADPSPS